MQKNHSTLSALEAIVVSSRIGYITRVMDFGSFHQDCIEKFKEKHVPGLAGTEEEIRNRWIMVHVGE